MASCASNNFNALSGGSLPPHCAFKLQVVMHYLLHIICVSLDWKWLFSTD